MSGCSTELDYLGAVAKKTYEPTGYLQVLT